jgi:hypothetical protein
MAFRMRAKKKKSSRKDASEDDDLSLFISLATEDAFRKVWENEDNELWESYLKD